jgi:hypothetical protein
MNSINGSKINNGSSTYIPLRFSANHLLKHRKDLKSGFLLIYLRIDLTEPLDLDERTSWRMIVAKRVLLPASRKEEELRSSKHYAILDMYRKSSSK